MRGTKRSSPEKEMANPKVWHFSRRGDSSSDEYINRERGDRGERDSFRNSYYPRQQNNNSPPRKRFKFTNNQPNTGRDGYRGNYYWGNEYNSNSNNMRRGRDRERDYHFYNREDNIGGNNKYRDSSSSWIINNPSTSNYQGSSLPPHAKEYINDSHNTHNTHRNTDHNTKQEWGAKSPPTKSEYPPEREMTDAGRSWGETRAQQTTRRGNTTGVPYKRESRWGRVAASSNITTTEDSNATPSSHQIEKEGWKREENWGTNTSSPNTSKSNNWGAGISLRATASTSLQTVDTEALLKADENGKNKDLESVEMQFSPTAIESPMNDWANNTDQSPRKSSQESPNHPPAPITSPPPTATAPKSPERETETEKALIPEVVNIELSEDKSFLVMSACVYDKSEGGFLGEDILGKDWYEHLDLDKLKQEIAPYILQDQKDIDLRFDNILHRIQQGGNNINNNNSPPTPQNSAPNPTDRYIPPKPWLDKLEDLSLQTYDICTPSGFPCLQIPGNKLFTPRIRERFIQIKKGEEELKGMHRKSADCQREIFELRHQEEEIKRKIREIQIGIEIQDRVNQEGSPRL